MLLARLLKHAIRTGDLGLVDAAGKHYRFGDGTAPHACVRTYACIGAGCTRRWRYCRR